MTDDLVKRLDDLDTILETEFDTQLSVQRNPYGATKAIEDALYLLRDQADRIEALTAEHNATLARLAGAVAREIALTAERDSLLSGHRILNIDGARLQARAEKAEAENDRAWAALWDILACETPNANATVTRMVAIAKAALRGENHD